MNWWRWISLVLAVAVATHVATLYAIPVYLMNRILVLLPMNQMYHGPRMDASQRLIPMPGTDMLYSSCPYDLSKGPLHIHADVPNGTYWSVSMMDSLTNNFFVRNDLQISNHKVDLILVSKTDSPAPAGSETVKSPTQTGLILFRTVIPDEEHVTEIDAARRNYKCW